MTRIVTVREFGLPTPNDEGLVLRLDYTGTVEAPRSPQGSRRYTTSSRHPGRSIQGTPTKLAKSGLVFAPLCACGQPAENVAHHGAGSHAFTFVAPRSNHG